MNTEDDIKAKRTCLRLVKKAPFKNVVQKLAIERIYSESLSSQAYIKRRISDVYFKKRGEDDNRTALKDCISYIRTLREFQKRSMGLIQDNIIINANKK
jgi:hypothetical protein